MNSTLNELFAIQNKIVSFIPTRFRRYIKIDWSKRLIVIVGARGTGKTTLVLQHFIETYKSSIDCLYFSVDNPLVANKGIYEVGKAFFTYFGNTLIIDEVHKQTNWAIDIKALYDSFPDKKIIILGSSKLNIINQKSDLSRRALIYNLKGLSFREFIELKYNIKFDYYSLEEILDNHLIISSKILRIAPEIKKYFYEYKQFGFYPFFSQYSAAEYQSVLHNVIDKIIYEDVPSLKNIKSSSSVIFKKLVAYLAISKIPTVNVSSMCNELDIKKETLYEFIDLLNRTDIINIIRRKNATIRSLKYSKILLLNPNLYFAISNELWTHDTDLGNIRESFFVSQIDKNIFVSKIVDYTINIANKTIEIEIGGKNKSRTQIKDIENGYLFKDDIEIGFENIIPLFLAGFLY
ncbi:MAG: AAA family ATPase [Candidatus Cloacimonadota bacterium]|nr:AAA family ATPase [Candidatus Cloacimonadota bacterium]